MRVVETHLPNLIRNRLKRARKVREEDRLYSDKKLFSMVCISINEMKRISKKRLRGDLGAIAIYVYAMDG